MYTFTTTSDDGIRLWVGGKKLVDNWTLHGPTQNSGSIALVAGKAYDLEIDYFQNLYSAVASLAWSSPSVPKQIVPTAALLPPGATTPTADAGTTTSADAGTTTSADAGTTPTTTTGTSPTLAGCAMFPADNAWNQDVSAMPVDPNSAAYMSNIAANGGGNLHPDSTSRATRARRRSSSPP